MPFSNSIIVPLEMRWADMDAFGHVNNVQFMRYLEEARFRFMHRELPEGGGTLADTLGEDFAPVVVSHRIEYREQLNYSPDSINVKMWVVKMGSSSFTVAYEVQNRAGTVIYAVATTTMVMLDRGANQAAELTSRQRDFLESVTGPAPRFR